MPPDTTATTGAGEGDVMDWEAAQPAADPPHPFDVLQLDEHIRAASAGTWDVPDLRPLQRDAIRLVVRPDRPNQVLLVAVTSAGKTHVLRVVGHILGGIGIIFIPLLTLSADVMAKFTAGDERWGSIEVQHLDELWLNDKRKYRDVLERLGNVERTTTSAVFVFLSPQFLVNHRDALNVFLEAARKRTLRLVALDEVHLHVQHGTSFRAEIRELRDVFFRPVFDRSAKADHPYVIAQTGTFPADYVADLTALTTVPFLPENVLRGSAKEFERREISIHLHTPHLQPGGLRQARIGGGGGIRHAGRRGEHRGVRELAVPLDEVPPGHRKEIGRGHMHVRAGKYPHAGVLDPAGLADRPPCNNKCPICTGAWHKIFAPCYKADVIQFLDNAQRVGKFPRAVKKGAKVSDILWGNKYWTERIFDRAASGVKRTTVDALFLPLRAGAH